MSRSIGFRGESIGWIRMTMVSFRVRRSVDVAPAVVDERERREERAEGDAECDAGGVRHDAAPDVVAALRRAAQASATMIAAGT
jgi:hypothetical protein